MHAYIVGPSCIRVNQSLTRSIKQREVEINNLYKNIFASIQDGLQKKQLIPKSSKMYVDYSQYLLNYLQCSYATPVSYKDQMHAEKQAFTARSIRKLIQSSRLVLRVTDKGNNFYVGFMEDFERKVNAYFTKTNAFRELETNPFDQIFSTVTQTLEQLSKQHLITNSQKNKLKPNLTKIELAHLYFNPKTHKV